MSLRRYKVKGVIFLFCLIFLFPCLAFAEEAVGPVEVDELEVETGGIIPAYTDYQGKIGEYMVFDRGVRPYWGFKGLGKIHDAYLRLEGFYEDEKDQVYAVDLDVRRAIKGEFDYRRFRHWTEHDPLTIRQTTPPFTYFGMSDEDSGTNYTLTRALTKSWMSLTCPRFPNINLHFNYREEGRDGERQALSYLLLNRELLADGRPMEQVTRDYKAGATFRKGILTIDDTFWYRMFKDEGSENVFMDGGIPFTQVPRFERYQNTLSARVDLPLYTSFYTNYAWYYVDAKGYPEEGDPWYLTRGEEPRINYHSLQTRLSSSPLKNLTVSGYYRYQNLDNEHIHKWYDSELPSAMTRENHTWAVDAAYRLLRSTSLRYGWEYETIGREDSGLEQVHYTETRRKTHRLSLNSKFYVPFVERKSRLRIEWKHDDTQNPFMNLTYWRTGREMSQELIGMGLSEELATYPPQLTCMPTDSDLVRWRFGVPLSPSFELSLDGEWGFRNFRSERDSQESQWKERYAQPTITLTYTPASNLSTYISYGALWKRTHTSFVPGVSVPYSGTDAEYKDEVHSWTTGLNYQAMPELNFSGYFTYNRQDAKFSSLLEPLADFGEFSQHNIHTWELSFACDYKISKALFANAQFICNQFNNDVVYLYDMNGTGYMGLIGISWRPL